MVYKTIIGILLLFSFSFQLTAKKSEILFRRISPDGGFTFGFINTIMEDSNGFIWFGTEDGLYRFTTNEITSYFHDQENQGSIPSDNIIKLFTPSDKNLWIITDKGICIYNQETDQFDSKKMIEPESIVLNSNIKDITQNEQGDFFTLHTRYVCRLDSQTTKYTVCPIPFDEGDLPASIYFDKANDLWVGTNNGALYLSLAPYSSFQQICKQRKESVRTICEDNNSIWIGYEWGGVDHITRSGKLITHFDQDNDDDTKLPHNRVRKIIKDEDNSIWIATYQGILIVNREGINKILADNYNELPHNSIKELYKDSQKGIWVGTWSGGLAFYNPNDNRFLHFKKNSDQNSLQGNIISSFTEDKNKNIWIGTEDQGLQVFDRKKKKFSEFKIRSNNDLITNIKCIEQDENSGLWVGTFSDGLWKIDLKSKKTKKYELFGDEKIRIYSLLANGTTIWIGTFGNGLFNYNPQTKELKKYEQNKQDSSLTSNYVRKIYQDSYGGLWIGTQNGLNYKPRGSEKFQQFVSSSNDSISSLTSNEIYSVYEDSKGLIWIGTEKGLNQYNPASMKFLAFTKKEGLSGNKIYSIQEDNDKKLWISTENGLSVFNLKNYSIHFFDKEDGLQGNQFNPNSSSKTNNGELLFGGSNGFNMINPQLIKTNPNIPKVLITKLFINNEVARVNTSVNSIHQTIISSEELSLDHNQNTLSFEFVSSNYIQASKNEFKYRLVNYNENWVYAGTDKKASFTKIPPGNYVFEVMASNNNGIWNTVPKRLSVIINPPLWATWYAYIFYLISAIILIWYVRKEIIVRQNLKKELLLERVKNENDEKLYQLKMKFFTNVTHEFRTPLTLILAPLEYLLNKTWLGKDEFDHLEMVKRNAMRLKILINQIIDFRKLELGKSEIHITRFDLVKFCTDIYSSFSVYAKDEAIEFNLSVPNHEISFHADTDKIEKILLNLLSNAFKNCQPKGQIDFIIRTSGSIESNRKIGFLTNQNISGKGIEFFVRNTGKIIPQKEIPSLFTRFYQSENSNGDGAGIGLHLCSEFAQLHNGSIHVYSESEKGTTFKLIIPSGNQLSETAGQYELKTVKHPERTSLVEETSGHLSELNIKTILIIEDNTEMLKYLKMIIGEEYKVITATDGKKGLSLANEMNPHLIISDILMPGIDGLELCKILKLDLQTSHIPIILLTALSEKDNKIDGLAIGADAYIEKPFDNEILKAQIKNLISSRESLKQSFIKSIDQWKENSDLLPFDKQLIEKAVGIVEDHLLDENFTVEHLAKELNFSRSSLHRKLRDLTDQTATELIRSVRLNKAIVLMRQGQYNMEEVSYAVGFSSPSYFSQSFKKQFGKSPKTYIQELSFENSKNNITPSLN